MCGYRGGHGSIRTGGGMSVIKMQCTQFSNN